MFFTKWLGSIFCTLFFKISLFALTYTTAVNGNWNNHGCWVNANIPSFDNADTIIIKHHIVLQSNLNLFNGAHLLIENNGGICGHVQLFVNSGSSVLKFGILEIDALNMSGGSVDLLPPGNTIFTQYGLLSGGTFNNTSNFFVGPWFECQMPEYQFLSGFDELYANKKIKVFPNPSTNFIFIDLPVSTNFYEVVIFNDKGAEVYHKEVNLNQNIVDVTEFTPGLYVIQIISQQSFASAKFCKY
jgi:hypothetical protein